MHYLVTGGTGFIGAACVRRLVQAGHQVRVLDNNSRGAERRLGDCRDSVELIVGDIRDPDVVRRSVAGVDSVLHLAYVNGTRFFYERPELVLDVGVRGMLNVLDACRAEGVRELILASSSEVYQTPPQTPTSENAPLSVPDVLNPRYSYGGGKLISELMTLNWGRTGFDRVMIFRPHNVYGPDMGWEHVVPQFALRLDDLVRASSERSIRFPILGNGQQTRSFIYIEDFVDGVMAVLGKGEHQNIYHIGTMDEVSIAQLAQAMGDIRGVDLELEFSEAPSGETSRRCPDIAKLIKLGFSPSTSLIDGLRPTMAWYEANRSEQPGLE